jgi:curved DNA-binding protein CbpA
LYVEQQVCESASAKKIIFFFRRRLHKKVEDAINLLLLHFSFQTSPNSKQQTSKQQTADSIMDKGESAYEVLGVSPKATTTEIKKSFRNLALKHHPDRQKTDADRDKCHHIFARLSSAYEILSDDDERTRHDRTLKDLAQKNSTYNKPTTATSSQKSKTPTSKPATANSSTKRTSKTTKISSNKKDSSVDPSNNGPKKTWEERTQQAEANSWGFAMGANDDLPAIEKEFSKYTFKSGKGFHDPYEVFRKVFKEEFGEEFVPGVSGTESKAARNKPSMGKNQLVVASGNKNNQLVTKDNKKSKGSTNEVDNRPVAMKMKTKSVAHPDGTFETITTTYITRPDGSEEVVVKSSLGHISDLAKKDTKKNLPSNAIVIYEEGEKKTKGGGTSSAIIIKSEKTKASKNKSAPPQGKMSTSLVVKSEEKQEQPKQKFAARLFGRKDK